MNSVLNGMFGKVADGMCRLSMSGEIAIKTSNGQYKSYNLKKNRLVNCTNFVFNIGDEFFFVIPTNKVAPGDIILVGGKPRCVISTDGSTIQAINYDDSTVETLLPERHVFMGNTYFYGKIVSMFGSDILGGGKKGNNKIMSYMMMSEMMKGASGGNQGGFGAMLPLMMMNGGGMNFFDGIFDSEDTDDDSEEVEE